MKGNEQIAVAISYIKRHFKEQPSLNEITNIVEVSPFHCQRLFTGLAGVSPKKFTQYLTLEYAKQLLKEGVTARSNKTAPQRYRFSIKSIGGLIKSSIRRCCFTVGLP